MRGFPFFSLALLLPFFALKSRGATASAADIVRMLVPGFTVRELPVRLSNINNLRFAPDGRLTALGYDGRIHLLGDTDGDGLEDQAQVFWDQRTLSVPVGMAWTEEGLYVSSHGKVSLLRDTNQDGKADIEEVIASGWPPTDVASGGVDATAVTTDREGNLYFALLVADYSNAYRLRKRKDLKPEEKNWLVARGIAAEGDPEEQVSLYDLNSPRGTIQKWNRTTRKLETMATGMRVPYTLAFNRHGDLFVTDQEGETWMPNGNPLDELNHLIPGRNYGFPPRHETWLPHLVSEPPVVAFGPQHQSTCGLVFNDPEPARNGSPARKRFGPAWWDGDALVAGESRGKIWRVRLVKTPQGYVGKQFTIARLSMLTTDLAISRRGDLYVSCHSGPPDWGTGPQGEGKLFKISYLDPAAPQPVLAWPRTSMEVGVAFDKPLDPAVTNAVVNQEIEFGENVRAGDRHEVLKPPYEVVQRQEGSSRGKLKIIGAHLEDEGQTLVLATDPHPMSVTYALSLPGVKAKGARGQAETVELDYDFTGVLLFTSKPNLILSLPLVKNLARKLRLDTSDLGWLGMLPSADMRIMSALGEASPLIKGAIQSLKAGAMDRYHLSTRLVVPADAAEVRVGGSAPFRLSFSSYGDPPASRTTNSSPTPESRHTATFPASEVLLLDYLSLRSSNALDLAFSYTRTFDPTPRPIPPQNFFQPDSPPRPPSQSAPAGKLNLTDADYERGRDLFFGEQLKCATCHRVRGEGATVGPDLSNLVHRDATSVLRDLKEPSATMHPDYVAYNVTLNSGEEMTGFVRAQNETALRLIGVDGKERPFPRTEVVSLDPSAVSLMPTGLLDNLQERQVRDLLMFLLYEPPKRTDAELSSQRAARPARQPPHRSLQLVLVASKQDHGPGQHDYPAWQTNGTRLLGSSSNLTASTAWEWPSPEQFEHSDVLILYFWNHNWSEGRYRQLDDFLARGGGVVVLHSATIADKDPELLAERIGLSAQPVRTGYRHTPIDLQIVAPEDHPITQGLPRQIRFLDETYWPMIGNTNNVEVLATAIEEGRPQPMIWTFQTGKGRVFASVLGHYTWTWQDPLFRALVLRGIAWAAGEDAKRFEN